MESLIRIVQSMDNHIPVLVFALKDPKNILRAVMGEKIGTIVGE